MKEFFGQRIVLYMGLALMIIGVSGLANDSSVKSTASGAIKQQPVIKQTAAKLVSNADGTIVSYIGIDGESVLDLLKSAAEVMMEQSSSGSYVKSINGVEETPTEYWTFYVNGQEKTVFSAAYITLEDDKIEWRLES